MYWNSIVYWILFFYWKIILKNAGRKVFFYWAVNLLPYLNSLLWFVKLFNVNAKWFMMLDFACFYLTSFCRQVKSLCGKLAPEREILKPSPTLTHSKSFSCFFNKFSISAESLLTKSDSRLRRFPSHIFTRIRKYI